MILNIKVNNFLAFSSEMELSMSANMHTKRFYQNVYSENNFNALKSACIYGANNSGKTCLVRAVETIKNILLDKPTDIAKNIFTDSDVVSFEISFMRHGRAFSYDLRYGVNGEDIFRHGFLYESLKELFIDVYGNRLEKEIYTRDTEKEIYRFGDNEKLSEMMKMTTTERLVLYTINEAVFSEIAEYGQIVRDFAKSIDIVYMNNIPMGKTLNRMRNDESLSGRIAELIKTADVGIDDYRYVKDSYDEKPYVNEKDGIPWPNDDALGKIPIKDRLSLVSVHRGKPVLSLSFDSIGTQRLAALAGYVADAVRNDRTLIVDEFGCGFHYRLARAIVALFNSSENREGQLIFDTFDLTFLDLKRMFRKEQIWFIDKDKNGENMYSLADFTAANDGIRMESDLEEKYKRGMLGAIPSPDFLNSVLDDFPESEVSEEDSE